MPWLGARCVSMLGEGEGEVGIMGLLAPGKWVWVAGIGTLEPCCCCCSYAAATAAATAPPAAALTAAASGAAGSGRGLHHWRIHRWIPPGPQGCPLSRKGPWLVPAVLWSAGSLVPKRHMISRGQSHHSFFVHRALTAPPMPGPPRASFVRPTAVRTDRPSKPARTGTWMPRGT